MALSKTLSKEQQQLYLVLKEKYDNLRQIADKLSQDNKSLKTRIEGVTTLSALLHEAREEISILKNKIKQLEEGVGILQSRLHKLGGKTDVILGDSEVILPGISKQILDSLVKDNLKLKQQLQQGTFSGLRNEERGEVINSLENQVKDLKKLIEEKEKELVEFRKVFENSGDKKDWEIIRLKEELKDLKYQDSNRDSLCQSLAQETKTLRSRLSAVSHLCQEFISQLDKQQDKVKENVEDELKKVTIKEELPFHLSTEDKNKALQDKCQELEQDKHRLAQQLHDVIQMNTRWQVYNSQRDEFVTDLNKQIQQKDQQIQKLDNKIRDLETLVKNGQAASPGLNKQPSATLADNQQEDIDRLLITARKRIDSLEAKSNRVEQLLNEEKFKNRHLEEQLKNFEPKGGSGSDREKLLEQQLMVYRDDFSQERRDRERVQGKLDSVQQQHEEDIRVIASLKREVALLKRQQHGSRPQQQHVAWNIPPSESAYAYAQPPFRGMTARGDFPPVYGGSTGSDCVDSSNDDVAPKVDGAAGQTESDSNKIDPYEDTLQCPKCNIEFPMSQHVKFLNHIDQCCS